MIERAYLKTLKSRTEGARLYIQVILGPRQAGKTTMVNQLLNKINIPYIF